jgi:hypothetical protein
MALKMTDSETNGTSVVTLDGRIMLGEESEALREKVKKSNRRGKQEHCSEHGPYGIHRQYRAWDIGLVARECESPGRNTQAQQHRA